MLSQVIEDGIITQSYFTTEPLTLTTKNADALILGGSAKEGGNIKVYRDTFGNLQMSLNADAASNTKALDVYGGVIFQSYLTVGQTTLNTTRKFYVAGNIGGYSYYTSGGGYGFYTGNYGLQSVVTNMASIPVNIDVSGTDVTDHNIKIQIDSNDIIVARATGNGAGGIINPAIGLYPGTTPTTQAAVISDPAESIAANNAAIDSILAALRGIGLIAT